MMMSPPHAPDGRVVVALTALTALTAIAALTSLAAGCALLVPGTLTDVRCSIEGAVGPPACPNGTFCHDGLCREGPPPLGEPCTDDDLCGPGDHCVDPDAWGFDGEPICSRPCCSSADCGVGTDLVCAMLGPGKMCLPAAALARGALGARFAGEPCDRGDDCRSGACSSERGHCIDTCCSDAECAPFGAACRAGPAGWSCAPDPGPTADFPLECKADADCASGLCVEWTDGGRRCASPCCSSTQCGQAKLSIGLRDILCVPVRHGDALVLACAAAAEEGATRAIGEPCDHPAQCRGGRCAELADPSGAPAPGVCADSCCDDASCGAPHLFTCAPAAGWDAEPLDETPSGFAQGFDLQCLRR